MAEDVTCILVHNVSHLDVFLSIKSILEARELEKTPPPFARPLFHEFHRVTNICAQHCMEEETGALREGTDLVLHESVDEETLGKAFPVGVALDPAIGVGPPSSFRLRDDRHVGPGEQLEATGIYFPLAAVLLPRWFRHARAVGAGRARLVLLLVSGEMAPRDETQEAHGNSTAAAARCLAAFAQAVYPGLHVRFAHSGPGVSRFDHSVRFVRENVLPLLSEERRRLVARFGEKWESKLFLTLSFASGAPARMTALSTGLRAYRPAYLHAFELKHLWTSGTLSFRDVDAHDFEAVDKAPSVHPDQLPPPLSLAAQAMREHHEAFIQVRDGWYRDDEENPDHPGAGGNDLATFWHRKSRKPVLGLLVVRRRLTPSEREVALQRSLPSAGAIRRVPEPLSLARGSSTDPELSSPASKRRRGPPEVNTAESPMSSSSMMSRRPSWALSPSAPSWESEWGRGEWEFCAPLRGYLWRRRDRIEEAPTHVYRCYRGINLEVSLPTGSLCAERAAIAAALADDPALHRRDCVAIAVLSATLLPRPAWEHLRHQSNPINHPIQPPPHLKGVSSSRIWRNEPKPNTSSSSLPHPPPHPTTTSKTTTPLSPPSPASAFAGGAATPSRSSPPRTAAHADKDPAPIPRPPLPDVTQNDILDLGLGRGIDGADVSLNPIPPCGACTEWLRRIAAAHPDFAVLTFTDTSCQSVFHRSIH